MGRRLLAALALLLTLAGTPALAQQATGYWAGTLEIAPGTQLRIGVEITRNEIGTLTGTLDSPDQQAFGIDLERVESEAGRLAFIVPAVAASYEGRWNEAARQWQGQFHQAGQVWPLALAADERAERPAPPQLRADWEVPGDAAIAAMLDRRIAQRPGAMIVAGVLEEDGSTRIIARGGNADGDTMFEIGSITKVFTALLLADMVQRRQVALDDPVARYLPEGVIMPRGGEEITLAQLSHHTSGLPRLPDNMSYVDPADPYAQYTDAMLWQFLGQHRLARAPGAQFEYSNLGAGLLGQALGRAAGRDYASLLGERVLGPLGLRDTAITLSAEQRARFAPGFDEFLRPTQPWRMGALPGAGALRSSAADMLRFTAALMARRSPLREALRLTMRTRESDDGGPLRGLGWLIAEFPSGTTLHHGGGTGGYRSHLALQPDGRRAVVVLTNSALEPGASDIALHLIAGTPLSPERPPPAPPPVMERGEVVELSTAQLDHVAGTYRLAPGVTMQVVRDGAQLTAQITSQPALAIYPTGPLDFFWRAAPARITFFEEAGQITRAILYQNGREIPLERIATQQGE